MKALFVDDELEVEILVDVLRSRYPDSSFHLADTLAEATRLIAQQKYDVIVLDVMMRADERAVPGSSADSGMISGVHLMNFIRRESNALNAATPVILLTGLLPQQHPQVQEAESTMGPRFVQKPVSVDEIYQLLKDAKHD
jgi:CheY-like chemotaxis protein